MADLIFTPLDRSTCAVAPGKKIPSSLAIPAVSPKGLRVDLVEDSAFRKSETLERVAFEEGLTEIDDKAFSSCPRLTEVTLPATLKRIGDSAFYGCAALRSLSLPEGLTMLGGYAFIKCASLTSLTFPSTLTTIPEGACKQCESLTEISFSNSPEGENTLSHVIKSHAFSECKLLKSVVLSRGMVCEKNAFKDCNNIELLYIDSPVWLHPEAFPLSADATLFEISLPADWNNLCSFNEWLCGNKPKMIYYGGTKDQFEKLLARTREGYHVECSLTSTTVYYAGEWKFENGQFTVLKEM